MGFISSKVRQRMSFMNRLGVKLNSEDGYSIIDGDSFNREEAVKDVKWDPKKPEDGVEESIHLCQDQPEEYFTSEDERLLYHVANEYIALKALGDRADATGGMSVSEYATMLKELTDACTEAEYDRILENYGQKLEEDSSAREYIGFKKRAKHSA